MDQEFFKGLNFKINDLIDDEQLSIGRVGHPFIVPKNYFIELKKIIFSKISEQSLKKPPFISINKKLKWVAIAASVTLFFGIFAYNSYFNKTNSLAEIESLDNDEIQAFIENQSISYTEIAYLVNLDANQIVDLESESITFEDLDNLESNENLISEIERL